VRRKPFIERKATLRKLLCRNEDIQYVAHIESDGAETFRAVYCLKETECAVSLRTVENPDQNQESDGTAVCPVRHRPKSLEEVRLSAIDCPALKSLASPMPEGSPNW